MSRDIRLDLYMVGIYAMLLSLSFREQHPRPLVCSETIRVGISTYCNRYDPTEAR